MKNRRITRDLRSSSAFGIWPLADGHHDVNIGRALPHHERATIVGVNGYALQRRRVGNDYHKVRSRFHPMVVAGWGIGVRVGVAASDITSQHVGDADFVGFEGLLVLPGICPCLPSLIQAHGHLAALLHRVSGGIACVSTGALLEDRTVPVLHDGSFGHLGRGGAQGLTDQCLLVLRACPKNSGEQKGDQNNRQSYTSTKNGLPRMQTSRNRKRSSHVDLQRTMLTRAVISISSMLTLAVRPLPALKLSFVGQVVYEVRPRLLGACAFVNRRAHGEVLNLSDDAREQRGRDFISCEICHWPAV